ncbi:hypothetical protein PR048_024527 [Dryococelus australis]|uniref:Uncharacterized protein n=1 Tax=Dryococelus australis TaxID=614101 RepID=A0ABQ9GNS9_9NEOP|nr:hypothetical protein PR048_024527 [Dryococelus australis]
MRVIEVNMETRRNGRAGETGDPREDPSTRGIVRHDSHLRKSGDPAGDQTRFALVVGEQANRSATMPPPPSTGKEYYLVTLVKYHRQLVTLSTITETLHVSEPMTGAVDSKTQMSSILCRKMDMHVVFPVPLRHEWLIPTYGDTGDNNVRAQRPAACTRKALNLLWSSGRYKGWNRGSPRNPAEQRHCPARLQHGENPGATPPGTEPCSPRLEASSLTTTPLRTSTIYLFLAKNAYSEEILPASEDHAPGPRVQPRPARHGNKSLAKATHSLTGCARSCLRLIGYLSAAKGSPIEWAAGWRASYQALIGERRSSVLLVSDAILLACPRDWRLFRLCISTYSVIRQGYSSWHVGYRVTNTRAPRLKHDSLQSSAHGGISDNGNGYFVKPIREKYASSFNCLLAYFTCNSDSTYDVTSGERYAQVRTSGEFEHSLGLRFEVPTANKQLTEARLDGSEVEFLICVTFLESTQQQSPTSAHWTHIYSHFIVDTNFSEAMFKIYFQDIPRLRRAKPHQIQTNYTRETTHQFRTHLVRFLSLECLSGSTCRSSWWSSDDYDKAGSAPYMRHGPSPLLEVSMGLATTQECSGETGWRLGPPRRIAGVGEDSRWQSKTLHILPQPSGRQSLTEAAWPSVHEDPRTLRLAGHGLN